MSIFCSINVHVYTYRSLSWLGHDVDFQLCLIFHCGNSFTGIVDGDISHECDNV